MWEGEDVYLLYNPSITVWLTLRMMWANARTFTYYAIQALQSDSLYGWCEPTVHWLATQHNKCFTDLLRSTASVNSFFLTDYASDTNPSTLGMVGRIMRGIGSNSTPTRVGIKHCSMCVKDVEELQIILLSNTCRVEEFYLDCVYTCLQDIIKVIIAVGEHSVLKILE